ncbi:MAG: hypothetical protein PHP73_03520 [Candidatus Omnitrophica bacterium]|nr:hypothetical protein [Candidatus Omnitrophota bacterium]
MNYIRISPQNKDSAKNNKIYLPIIFGISFLFGSIFLIFSLRFQQQYDALNFIQYAQDIVSGGLWKCGMAKEPGYPILISPLFWLFSESNAVILVRITNILLFSASATLFFLVLRILMPNSSLKRVFVFSLPFTLSPQLASFSALRVYSEPLQLFLNSLILFCLMKISLNEENSWCSTELKFWIIAALAAGWLVITKAFFLIYPFWLVFFILVYRILFTKKSCSIKIIAKPIIMFLCISLLFPFLWSARNYKKYGYAMVAIRGADNLLAHAYLVDWDLKDSLKWGIFQLSNKLGEVSFPSDSKRMAKITGEPYIKSTGFLNSYNEGHYSNTEISAIAEWHRLVKEHPFRYIWFYCLNALNHVLFEGVYPDIFPEHATRLTNYIYLASAIILHFLYSILIYLVIIAGVLKYALRSGVKSLLKLRFKHALIIISLGYFYFFAYHFHTETRYFYPFYVNIYLIFALSCDYLFRGYEGKNGIQ